MKKVKIVFIKECDLFEWSVGDIRHVEYDNTVYFAKGSGIGFDYSIRLNNELAIELGGDDPEMVDYYMEQLAREAINLTELSQLEP